MKSIFLLLIPIFGMCIGCSRPNAEGLYSKALDAQKNDQFDDAIDTYKELIRTYPDSTRTPEAYYAVGMIYLDQKRSYHDAIHTFQDLEDKYPNHGTAPNASFLIGFIYNNNLKNIDSARIAYEDFLKRYSTNHLVGSVQFELSNLGKDPAEILKAQTQIAQEEIKPVKKVKK